MSARDGLSRRTLLKAVAAAAVAVLGVARPHAPSDTPMLAARLRALVPHRAGAAIIGASYLERAASEASADALVSAIIPARLRRAAGAASDARLGALVARAMRDDFANGRTVVLRGWIVSITEARLAALVLVG
jgi:hypothetical protein